MKKSTLNRAVNAAARVKYIREGGSNRFSSFIKWVLSQHDIEPELHYSLSLLALDGVSLKHLPEILKCRPYLTNDGPCVSYISKINRFYRFTISSITSKIYSNLSAKANFHFDINAFTSLYAKFAGHKNTLNEFNRDQILWFAQHMSGPLFEHLCGNVEFSGVPDSAFARLSSKQRLITENMNGDIANKSICEALSGYLEPLGEDKNAIVVDRLINACRRRKLADHISKKLMLDECLSLSNLAKEAGPISSLIVAWATSLIANGSRAQQNLSQAAIYNYISSISLKLLSVLKSKDIQSFNESNFADVYKKIIDSASDGQKKIAASAISTFHHFLEAWLDAPFIPRYQYQLDFESIPQSNLIWPHEIDTVLNWLSSATCDERLIQIWQLAFMVGSEKRIRIGELIDIQIKDIVIYQELIKIQITGQKSKAAKRVILIQHQATITHLKSFLNRRHKEGALKNDFLFGDPKKPKSIYKLGQFYFGLNSLLKVVSGERLASFHWLSDMVISLGLQEILVGGSTETTNPYSQFSTEVGHASIITTCVHYMHLHHAAIRGSINAALTKVSITSDIAEKWSSTKAATIRKQISDQQIDTKKHYWNVIFSAPTESNHITSLNNAYQTEVAQPPEFLSSSNPLNFLTVLHLLKDISNGLDADSVMSRQGLDEVEFGKIIQTTRDILFNHRIIENLDFNATVIDTFQTLISLKHHGISFNKALQPKYERLRLNLNKQLNTSDSTLNSGLFGWITLFSKSQDNYLALDESADSLKFLQCLAKAQADISRLCVFVANTDATDVKNRINGIKKLFISTFSVSPPFFIVQQRRGRPKAYLSITDQRVNSKQPPHSSANSMSGLNAIYLAMLIFGYSTK